MEAFLSHHGVVDSSICSPAIPFSLSPREIFLSLRKEGWDELEVTRTLEYRERKSGSLEVSLTLAGVQPDLRWWRGKVRVMQGKQADLTMTLAGTLTMTLAVTMTMHSV